MTDRPRALVAGASGAVGSRVASRLLERGWHVRALSRDAARSRAIRASETVLADATDPLSFEGALGGIDLVISCLGANVSLRMRERRSYATVDTVANGNLLDAAVLAGARRFVYVGVFNAPGYASTRYCAAHERFVERLRAAPLTSTVVRPTGIFTALDDLVGMARLGIGSVVGDGKARTNPVHPDDVADAVVGSVEAGPADLPIGGPETFTREALLGLAFEAVGKPMRGIRMPPALFRAYGWLLRPLHPRLSELLEFVAAVSTHDAVAEPMGTRRLADWFAQVALAGRTP